jgi:branched-chain amino acid transport system substrate-binding protein
MPRTSRLGPVAALSLLVVACAGQPSMVPSPAGSAPPSATASMAPGPPEVCETDEYGCAVVRDGDPILIGSALTLTGPDAALGLDSQYGAQVALNLRGPVLDREAELVNHDDRCSADGGTAAATLLEAVDGLVGVIGTSCSAAAGPAARILGERGILLLSPSNTAPSLTEPGEHEPFYARVAHSDGSQATAMAEFACSELAVASGATIHDGSAAATQLEATFVAAFEERCEGRVSVRATVSDGEDVPDTLAEIAASVDGGPPELIYFPVEAELAVRVARQARETPGLGETFLAGLRAGQDGRDGSAVISAAAEDVEGIYVSGADLGYSGQFYESLFLQEYANVAAAEEPLAGFHGHAYDAVNILLNAVEAVAIEADGALFVPRSELLNALRRITDYQGLSGALSCGESGDCARASIAIWQVAGGEYQPVWP